jgi:hypothetical protein
MSVPYITLGGTMRLEHLAIPSQILLPCTALGFTEIIDTGGGMTAWRKTLADGTVIDLCADGEHNADPDAEWCASRNRHDEAEDYIVDYVATYGTLLECLEVIDRDLLPTPKAGEERAIPAASLLR